MNRAILNPRLALEFLDEMAMPMQAYDQTEEARTLNWPPATAAHDPRCGNPV
jgi:hypothetical protein